MPDLDSVNRAIVIAPHADDEVLGCGGLMASLADRGCEVRVLFASLDGMKHAGHGAVSFSERRREVEAVASLLHFDWDVDLAKPMAGGQELPDLWALFGGLREVPVLALRGALSDVLSADTFERMGQALPHMKRVTVSDVGHAPTLNEPQSRRAVDDFLAGF